MKTLLTPISVIAGLVLTYGGSQLIEQSIIQGGALALAGLGMLALSVAES